MESHIKRTERFMGKFCHDYFEFKLSKSYGLNLLLFKIAIVMIHKQEMNLKVIDIKVKKDSIKLF